MNKYIDIYRYLSMNVSCSQQTYSELINMAFTSGKRTGFCRYGVVVQDYGFNCMVEYFLQEHINVLV